MRYIAFLLLMTGPALLLPSLAQQPDPLVRTLESHKGSVLSVAFSPQGKVLASGSRDKTIKLWDAKSGKLLQTLEQPDQVYSVAFSRNGAWMASAGADKVIRLWDIRTAKVIRVFEGHTAIVRSVKF